MTTCFTSKIYVLTLLLRTWLVRSSKRKQVSFHIHNFFIFGFGKQRSNTHILLLVLLTCGHSFSFWESVGMEKNEQGQMYVQHAIPLDMLLNLLF